MAERLRNEINFGLNGPVQVNYEYCKGCGARGLTCWKPHRFFTYEGYLSVMMKFYPGENTPGKVLDMAQEAEDFFPGGFEHGEIGKCLVCERPHCNRPHRKYTREGYAKFQIEVMGIERSEAIKRANEEFRVCGGDWSWYPMNREGHFAPPIPDGSTNVRAPPPPVGGWPKVKSDRYYDIMRAIKAAWKAESARKSEAELFRPRDDFDQRWANKSGEEEPKFKMPWNYLPRAPQNVGGDGSRAQCMGSAGGFHGSYTPRGHDGGHTGHTPAGGTYAGVGGAGPLATFDPAAFAVVYGNLPGMEGLDMLGIEGFMPGIGRDQGGQNIPGMPNISMSESGGAGFTHQHQEGQSPSYGFPAGSGEPQQPQQPPHKNHQNQQQKQYNQVQIQIRNQHQNLPPAPKSNVAAQSKNQNKGNNEKQNLPNPADQSFNKDFKFYAETYIKKTKGKPLGEARIWRNVPRKKFQDQWGLWTKNANLPRNKVPEIDDYDNDRPREGYYNGGSSLRRGGDFEDKSASDYMREANYNFGEGYKRWNEAGGKLDSSFDEGYERWKKSQGEGEDIAGSNAADHLRAANYDFMGGYENWKRAGGKMDSSFDEGNAEEKSQHRQDDPDIGTKSSSTRKSEGRERKHRRYDRDSDSDYESDASRGPQYPSAPSGAGNRDYEDA